MPWIESHQSLKDHPKLINLCQSMMWDVDCGIGKLSRFWWWCLDYAPDGDLSKFNDGQISHAMGVAIRDSAKLVEAMVASRWIDRTPYFRVHDWWDYVGRYLKIKWKDHPSKWQAVKDKYTEGYTDGLTDGCTSPATPSTDLPTKPTNQPRGAGGRLHGIPSCVEDVVAYGKTINPKVSEDRCRAFWSYYEGQAKQGPNGETFWVTGGERGTVITNWKVKLPAFGTQNDGSNQRSNNQSPNRNQGTANQGKASQYSGLGKVGGV